MTPPSFKHRPIRMYIYFVIHLLLLGIIIVNSALPASKTQWMNEIAANIVNNIVDAIKGVKPVYPSKITIDKYSNDFLSFLYNEDTTYHVLEGSSRFFHIDLQFPKGADESLKHKELSITSSDGYSSLFNYWYDKNSNVLYITGKKESKNNYVTLKTTNGKKVVINFDVEKPFVPTSESIGLSNNDVKIGSSFFINSTYLESYEDIIFAHDYHLSSAEDPIYGGKFYTNLDRDASYWPNLCEFTTRKYFDLSNHQYISDDSHIVVDEENGVVSVNPGASIGEHVITSSLGGEVRFNVNDEPLIPIDIDSLSIKSTKGYANPNQGNAVYMGQTLTLDNEDILKEHAFKYSISDSNIGLIDLKKHMYGGIFDNRNEVFVRGLEPGETDISVSLYGYDDIKLEHHVVCDTMENLFNYEVSHFIDDELYDNQVLKINHRYKFETKIHDLNTDSYLDVPSIGYSKAFDRYIIEEIDGVQYITFKNPVPTTITFEYRYIEQVSVRGTFRFNIAGKTSPAYSNVDQQTVRKIVGHGIVHFFCTLFLILFLLVYFKDHKWKYWSFAIAAGLALFYASITEVIQLAVPSRDPNIKDVGLDYLFSLGALLIVGTVVLIAYLIKRKKQNKTE